MALDLSSLFHTSIKFDHLGRALSDIAGSKQSSGYPPYNIIKLSDNNFRISLALAGFKASDVSIILDEDILIIKSLGKANNINDIYLYKGIAYRAFEKKFRLASNVKIQAANLFNGLLDIDLIKIIPKKSKAENIIITEKKYY